MSKVNKHRPHSEEEPSSVSAHEYDLTDAGDSLPLENGLLPPGSETELPEQAPHAVNPARYINRELSWLAFNERVLEEAFNERHPLLERVKFLAIFGSNLDEFFMIRVSGLQAQRTAGVADVAVDGLTPTDALAQIALRVSLMLEKARRGWHELRVLLKRQQIEVIHFHETTETEKQFLAHYFDSEIAPILTPLSVDPGHPFPHISNLSLNLALEVHDPEHGERFARIKIPGSLPRLIPCASPDVSAGISPTLRLIWLEEVIAHHVGALFPGMNITATYLFRVTRNADIEIQEDEAEDLLRTIEQGIRERHFGFVTRLEVTPAMPVRISDLLVQNLEMDGRNLVSSDGEMGHSALMELMRLDRPDLKDAPLVPRLPAALRSGEDIFTVLARQDVLLHHPFDSFQPVINLVEAAAHDSHVRAIKQTLYRVGSNSPLVAALIAARDADTQVAVLLELKARFDEENNIVWARALEQVGVHVVYGLIGLKTHCKVLLVVRREASGIRRYVHLGTGNYNATTARIYTDFGLMTSDPDLGADASDLFNYLTGYSRQTTFRKILVAPINLRQRMAELIERETHHAQSGKPARIIFQMNALVDPQMIDLLYAASQAGVQIDLIIRGICCLRPGVAGLSENIRVTSIVGRFLEHARVYYFANHLNPELYMGSADLMQRNLDRRVEVLFPVENPDLRDQVVSDVLALMLSDNTQARRLLPDGTWESLRPESRRRRIDSQAQLLAGMGNGSGSSRKRAR